MIKGKFKAHLRIGIPVLTCLCLLALSAYSFSDKMEHSGGFKIAPYFIHTPDHHILMKFALAGDPPRTTPLIKVNGNIHPYHYQQDAVSGLVEVDLEAVPCDQKMEVTLTSADDTPPQKTVSRYSIPSFACSADRAISFLFIADTHGNASFFAREVPIILKRHSDKNIISIIHGGDWLNDGADLAAWNAMARAAGEADGGHPILSAIGNHEYHGYTAWEKLQKKRSSDEYREQQPTEQRKADTPRIFKKYFLSGKNDVARGYNPAGYYTVHYPQAVLIVINSNQLGEKDGGNPWTFIKRETAAAAAEKKPIIVVSHHSLLGSNIFRINKIEGKRLRENLIPILEEQQKKFKREANGADHGLPMIAVLSAHCHLYEESGKNGIVYLNAGAFGGWPMFGLWGNPYQKTSSSFVATYSIVTVSKRGIAIETHKANSG